MLGIGINENVVITKLEKTDKGAMIISWGQHNPETAEVDAFAMLNDDSGEIHQDSADGLNIFVWPIDNKGKDDTIASAADINKRVGDVKNLLVHIAQQYMLPSEIKLSPFRGTGITNTAELNEKITSSAVLEKITDNLFSDFMEIMAPYINNPQYLVRVLFLRRSKKAAFPDLRKKFLKDNPFIEPMAVAKENSKLKFTNYEIKEGLNSADPVETQANADAVQAAPAAGETSVFDLHA